MDTELPSQELEKDLSVEADQHENASVPKPKHRSFSDNVKYILKGKRKPDVPPVYKIGINDNPEKQKNSFTSKINDMLSFFGSIQQVNATASQEDLIYDGPGTDIDSDYDIYLKDMNKNMTVNPLKTGSEDGTMSLPYDRRSSVMTLENDQEYRQWAFEKNRNEKIGLCCSSGYEAPPRRRLHLLLGVIVLITVLLTVLITVLVILYSSSEKAPNVVLNSVVIATFDKESKVATFSADTLKSFPKLNNMFSVLFGAGGFSLVKAFEKDRVIKRRDIPNTDVLNQLKTWFQSKFEQIPLLPDGVKKTLCGSTGKSLNDMIPNSHCCITFVLEGGFHTNVIKGKFNSDQVNSFLTCDLEKNFDIKNSLRFLNVDIMQDASPWVGDITLLSSGKIIISTITFPHDQMTIDRGITIIANANISRVPESIRPAAKTFIESPFNAVTFEMQATFPFHEQENKIIFKDARLTVSASAKDISFGDQVLIQRLRFELNPGGFFNIGARLRVRETPGSEKYILTATATSTWKPTNNTFTLAGRIEDLNWSPFDDESSMSLTDVKVQLEMLTGTTISLRAVNFNGVGSLGYVEQKASLSIKGDILLKANGETPDICAIAHTRLDDVLGLIVRLSGSSIEEVNKIVFFGPTDVYVTLCSSERIFDGMHLLRGLGVTITNGGQLENMISENLVGQITQLTTTATDSGWFASFFLPVFDEGIKDWTLQVHSNEVLHLTPTIDIDHIEFFVKVSGGTLSNLHIAGNTNIALHSDTLLSYGITGGYSEKTQTFTLTGDLLSPWNAPFGLEALSIDMSSCEIIVNPLNTSVSFNTKFMLLYTRPETEISLDGYYLAGDSIPSQFHFGTAAPIPIQPLLPSVVSKVVANFSGNVNVVLTNGNYINSHNFTMQRGLNIYSPELEWKFADSKIGEVLSKILGAGNMPNKISHMYFVVPVLGDSSLISQQSLTNSHNYEFGFSLPDQDIWENVIALKNTYINMELQDDFSGFSFTLQSSIRVTILTSHFVVDITSRLGSEVQALSAQTTMPAWNDPFGIKWIRFGRSLIQLTLSSEQNTFFMSTSLEFGTGPTLKFPITVDVNEKGAALFLYDIKAVELWDMIVYAIQDVVNVPEPTWLLHQLQKTTISFVISTYNHWKTRDDLRYRIGRGLNLFVDIQIADADCRGLSEEEKVTRDDCELEEISMLKDLLPVDFQKVNFHFGVVLPIFSFQRRRSHEPFKIFVMHNAPIHFSNAVSLLDVMLSINVDLRTVRRHATETIIKENIYPRKVDDTNLMNRGYGKWRSVESKSRRALSGSGEIATHISLKIDSNTTLIFESKGRVVSSEVEVSARVEGSMYGDPWYNAFGIDGLTIRHVTIGLGLSSLCPPCITFAKLGAILPLLLPLATKASYEGPELTLIDFFEFINYLRPDTINISLLPSWISNIFGISRLLIEISNSNSNIPDYTSLDLANDISPSQVPSVKVQKGFRFECDVTVFGVSVHLKSRLVYNGLIPDFQLDFILKLQALNDYIEGFVNLLRHATNLLLLGAVNIKTLDYVFSFRLTEISLAQFSVQALLKGNLPHLEIKYELEYSYDQGNIRYVVP